MNDLTGMTPEELRDFSTGLGEKSFRGGQIFSWIHQHGSESFAEMTTLSKELRRKLESKATLQIPEVIDVTESGETASRKFLSTSSIKSVCNLSHSFRIFPVGDIESLQ